MGSTQRSITWQIVCNKILTSWQKWLQPINLSLIHISVTFGFGATDNKADETQSHIDKQLPNAPVEPEVIAEPESQSSEVIITLSLIHI